MFANNNFQKNIVIGFDCATLYKSYQFFLFKDRFMTNSFFPNSFQKYPWYFVSFYEANDWNHFFLVYYKQLFRIFSLSKLPHSLPSFSYVSIRSYHFGRHFLSPFQSTPLHLHITMQMFVAQNPLLFSIHLSLSCRVQHNQLSKLAPVCIVPQAPPYRPYELLKAAVICYFSRLCLCEDFAYNTRSKRPTPAEHTFGC